MPLLLPRQRKPAPPHPPARARSAEPRRPSVPAPPLQQARCALISTNQPTKNNQPGSGSSIVGTGTGPGSSTAVVRIQHNEGGGGVWIRIRHNGGGDRVWIRIQHNGGGDGVWIRIQHNGAGSGSGSRTVRSGPARTLCSRPIPPLQPLPHPRCTCRSTPAAPCPPWDSFLAGHSSGTLLQRGTLAGHFYSGALF